MLHCLLLFQSHTHNAVHPGVVVVSGNLFTSVQNRLEKIGILRVDDGVRGEQDLNKVDILLLDTVKHEADVFEIHVFVILHNVGSAERFGVQHEIGKAGQHDCLGVNITTLIVKIIILRTLQEEANPASPAMLQDGHQMFPHPRHDLLALLLILDQSRHHRIAPF